MKKRSTVSLQPSKLQFALLIIPITIVYGFVIFLPLLNSLWYSFHKIVDYKLHFVGLQNYIEAFRDSAFFLSIKNNFIIIILSVLFQLTGGFFIAALMRTRWVILRDFIRTTVFLPVVLSPVVISLLWILVYNKDYGIFNAILRLIGLSNYTQLWLDDPKIVIYSVSLPIIWQFIGLYFVIFLAGFSGIPDDVLESVEIDGANFIQKTIYITMPMLASTWKVALILAVSGGLKIFDHILVMTSGGPGLASTVAAQYAYNESLLKLRFGYGSTLANLILIISFICVLAIMLFMKNTDDK